MSSLEAPKPLVDLPAGQTPVMRQYMGLKAQHPEAVLLFRLGDFYELFDEDARRAAPVMELVLTQRQGIAMCGLPHHQLPGYLAKLMKAGYCVAIAEQMEDPSQSKGMVRREVVRVVTPGTVIEEELLVAKENCFLVAASPLPGKAGRDWVLAALDTSTGEFFITHIERDESGRRLAEELARLDPRELLLPQSAASLLSRPATPLADAAFDPSSAVRLLERLFQVSGLAGFGVDGHPALGAAGAVLGYLEKNQPRAVEGLRPPKAYRTDQSLVLDELALRHLDLFPSDAKRSEGPSSLWDVLDHAATPMGGRRLKSWLLRPLRDAEAIHVRQDQVAFLLDRGEDRRSLAAILRECADVDRVLARLSAGSATGRDLTALRRTLRRLPEVSSLLAPKALDESGPVQNLLKDLEAPEALTHLLSSALAEDPPFRLSDGGVIRDGHSAALDELRDLAKNGRAWISDLEAQEKKSTGISTLKIGYTSVFGYYLEVSKGNLSKVPPQWVRKQTLANAERFITPELKTQEDKILGAEEKSKRLEAEIFSQVRVKVLSHKDILRRISDALSELDAAASLAEASSRGRWVRPRVTADGPLRLVKARHPVVDRALPAKTPFVPNDIFLDGRDRQVLLITGPNMGGKSTYLRQTALIVILAQMGSFVPAEEAEVGLVDRVFTRIGAGDNLAAGASTFLVEMQEVANILHNATPRSLILLDEVGRGTSTYDGVAVAWAVLERLHRPEGRFGPKVLFATHYFELTALPDRLPGVVNVHAAVREWTLADGRQELVFLHQIQPGPAERSFGVHVAQMAGLPAACVARAKEVLSDLEKNAAPHAPAGTARTQAPQLELFISPVLKELQALETDRLTPLEALQILHRLSTDAKKT
jgi:DNA mismatch repair protein MutS